MAKKVILHVGSPKTGTSFLQDLFFREHERLAEQGILYPAERFDQHFMAAVDLMGLKWGGLEADAVGEWDRLAEQVRAWPGTAIVSHEILARARPEDVARARESLGGDSGDIEIVLSARDLVRQIPAEWQENVKHRRVMTFAEFLAGIRDPERASNLGQWFWGVQETPDILRRWGQGLSPDKIHVVTVPHAGAAPDELWRRFCAVFDLDPVAFAESGSETRTNASLGVTEVATLRVINQQLSGVLENPDYRALVRESMVHQNLSTERTSARLSVPPEIWSWADNLSRGWVDELTAAGYDVIGDLQDLVPAPALPWVDPDVSTAEEREGVLLRAVTATLLEGARLREVIEEQQRLIDSQHRELAKYYAGRVHRAKERVVAKSEDSAVISRGLGLYRRLRRD